MQTNEKVDPGQFSIKEQVVDALNKALMEDRCVKSRDALGLQTPAWYIIATSSYTLKRVQQSSGIGSPERYGSGEKSVGSILAERNLGATESVDACLL